MYELFLALFLAFSCPAQMNNSGKCHKKETVATTNSNRDKDSGGDTEHIPPHFTGNR